MSRSERAMINLSVKTNGEIISLPKGFPCSDMRLWDYHFYTNDTIINQYNNTITVMGTSHTLTVGNYSASPSVFASYLSTVLASDNITVTYDSSITNLLTFTTTVPWTVGTPFTLTLPSDAKGLYGLGSTTYTVTSGTTFTSEFPVHFSNSDYYFIDIQPAISYEFRAPEVNSYAYKVINDVIPGDLLYHKIQEPLQCISSNNNCVTYIKTTVYDQYGHLVPNNGTTWNFFLELIR